MRQHIPFHVHVSSMDSGSTVEAMIDRFIELQKDLPVKYATITDHGFMGDCFKFYDVCKKKKVRPILGVEGYFKDDSCSFLQGQEANLKYNHIILHFIDQEAYQKGCELLSKADARGIVAGGERKPLFNWADLEELSKYNVTLGTACLLGMATRYLLINRADLAVKYYLKLRDMFKDNFYVEILPHVCDKKWENGVRLFFDDNTSLFVRTDSKLDTDYKDEVTAQEIYNYASKVNFVKARYYRKQKIEINKKVISVERVKDFVLQEEGDVQLNANRFCLAMAMKYGDKIVISDDAHYATREDKVVQDMRLGEDFRFYGSYHLMDKIEVYDYFQNIMGISEEMIDSWVENSYAWAKKFDNFELKYEYCLPVPEKDSLIIIGEWIKEMGRMKNDPVYVDRLKHEINTLKNNGVVDLLPYFLPIKEAIKYYSDHGEFCSVGRGSAAASLIGYLIGITHIDPIKYKLPFERFYSIDRAQSGDIPDIDCDFGSRELLVGTDKQSGFLYGKYGDCAAQISTRMLMRLKSSIKDVNRFINKGSVEPEIDKIAEGLPTPPQGVSDQDFVYGYTDTDGNEVEGILDSSDVLKKYIENRPNEWKIVERALGLSRNNSSHASAFAIASKPIREIVPTFSLGKTENIIQYDAKSTEMAKIIKYDFLCVSAYKDINMCIKLINKKNNYTQKTAGWFLHEGKDCFLGDLPHSIGVYEMLHRGELETLFQISTSSMYPFVTRIKPTSVEELSDILALCRPGPMDYTLECGRTIAEEYIWRKQGKSSPDDEIFTKILPNTQGLCIYQENVNSIVKEIGGVDPITAEKLRKMMSKKKKAEVDKFKPTFVNGAISNGISKEKATQIWEMLETFAKYSFCLGHSVSYSYITYITAFLKHHYPLEWWAAVLSNADDKEVNQVFYKHIKDMITPPDINLSDESITIDYTNNKLRSKLSLVSGLGEKAAQKIKSGRPYHSIVDLVEKQTVPEGLARKLIYLGVMDGVFNPNMSTLSKMQAYEDALVRYKKIEKIQESISKNDLKIAENFENPKELVKLNKKHDKLLNDLTIAKSLIGQIPEEFIGMSPIKDFVFKKQLLPSLPLQLHPLMKKYCDFIISSNGKTYVEDDCNRTVSFVPGDVLQLLEGRVEDNDLGYATAAYVLEAKEFVYGGTKRALKMNCDIDGFSTELVLWPNYDSGELIYPDGLKGSVALLFFYKKQGKNHGRITQIKKIGE